MLNEITIDDFLRSSDPLIDVRSPGEFMKGHVPGAVNIALFTDAERAHVGTVYVKNSQAKATELAYEYIRPKLENFILQSRVVAPAGNVTVHCWRGGMRSRSFAQHLHENGFGNVSVISGGYKAYRNHILHSFEHEFKLNIIGGYTGSGKTGIIKQIQKEGFQAIDLEKLAHHKGSAFGHIGEKNQPTAEQFENNLFEEWRKLDLSSEIWLEDESRNIGGVNIPMPLYLQMQNAPVYFIDIPREKRALYLVVGYTGDDFILLEEAIRKIARRLGGMATSQAIELVLEKKYYEAALLMLHYYDKSYLKAIRSRNRSSVHFLMTGDTDAAKNTKIILKFQLLHERNKTHTV
jgi:tRNA 2-selenouridine synthase